VPNPAPLPTSSKSPELTGFFVSPARGLSQLKENSPEALDRNSHQAAQDTYKTRIFWSKVSIVENTVCYSSLPVTVQAGVRVRKLALHSNRSYGYAFRSRAALVNTTPAPAPVILVRNAG
jgi:hypothetical protein